MSDEQAFLDPLKANPADDTTRLVYADWLDDHGEAAKAEYLRLVVRAVAVGVNGAEGEAVVEQLRHVGRDCPGGWAAGDRFEVVFVGAPGWSWPFVEIIHDRVCAERIEIQEFVQVAPAILMDRARFEDAEAAASDLTERCLVRLAHPGVSEYARMQADLFRTQIGKHCETLFVVRPMGLSGSPPASRFEVVLSGRRLLHADLLAGPLRDLLGVPADDLTHALYTGTPAVVQDGLSFAAAVAAVAQYRKGIKRHSLARVISETTDLAVRATPAAPDDL
jgi:uncharacterized protein (TIGR02996 family)